MFENLAISEPVFKWVVLPLLICLARVVDVTIGTLRIVFLSKGRRVIAPVLGFFEVLIWLAAISQVMKHMDHPINALAFALGFALGTWLGIVMEEKLSVGYVMLRIVTRQPALDLIEHFRKKGYRMTYVDAEGLKGPVQVLFTLTRRKQLNELMEAVHKYNPQAVYSIEDVRNVTTAAVQNPLLPADQQRGFRRLPFQRKGK